jgi:hypothetical protein
VRTLTEIMNANGSDKGTEIRWAHGYTLTYEQWFEPIRGESLRLLEIGVCAPEMPGASLKGWYEYFPNATIFGYDIADGRCFDNDRIKTFIGDQSDPADLARFLEFSGGAFDIIIDDGSHKDAHQQASLTFLFPHLTAGGQYFIEDLQVSPNTMSMLRRMRLPGDWSTSKASAFRAFFNAVQHGARFRFSPYISANEIDEIYQGTERLDLMCNAKLARFTKRSMSR